MSKTVQCIKHYNALKLTWSDKKIVHLIYYIDDVHPKPQQQFMSLLLGDNIHMVVISTMDLALRLSITIVLKIQTKQDNTVYIWFDGEPPICVWVYIQFPRFSAMPKDRIIPGRINIILVANGRILTLLNLFVTCFHHIKLVCKLFDHTMCLNNKKIKNADKKIY